MGILSFDEIRQRIDESNRSAAINNRNLYPIQEQASLTEIWEYVNGNCDDLCECNNYNRTQQWKLKNGLVFEDIIVAYLRMYVDSRRHQSIMDIVEKSNADFSKLPQRIKGAVVSLYYLRDNWEKLYNNASNNMKTLLCDDWCNEFWKNEFNFPISDSVYKAKQYSILLPNICIPYDNASRNKIKRFLGLSNNSTYFEMLQKLRRKVIEIIDNEKSDLVIFQRLDDPSKVINFNHSNIALRRADINYGHEYLPSERPISRVIDKMFYKPTV